MILAVPARAKLNLDLEVIRKRPDGFHDLKTTFQAIDVHDLIEIEPATQTTVTSDGFAINPTNNSVINAHGALELAAGRALNISIHVTKRIPPGSGMGGASSDAAATLMALQKMFNLNVDSARLAEQLGSDVPFFLQGGRATAHGRGERLTHVATEREWFAVAWPGYEISTAAVYAAWDGTRQNTRQNEPMTPNELRAAAEHVEPRLKQFAHQLGDEWHMTGSGSAFFKRMRTRSEAEQALTKIEAPWKAVAQAIERWA